MRNAPATPPSCPSPPRPSLPTTSPLAPMRPPLAHPRRLLPPPLTNPARSTRLQRSTRRLYSIVHNLFISSSSASPLSACRSVLVDNACPEFSHVVYRPSPRRSLTTVVSSTTAVSPTPDRLMSPPSRRSCSSTSPRSERQPSHLKHRDH